jgi:predicted secreted protein
MIRVLSAVLAPLAIATAGPVGPLPPGPTRSATLRVGAVLTISLPKPRVAGRVWRIARPFDGKVVREIAEGETARTIWWRFRAVGPGETKIVLAQTLGERSHAYAARTSRVVVRR